jgi:hypothetical protein
VAGAKPEETKPEPSQTEINGWPSKVALAKELEIPIKRLNNWIRRKNVRRGTASDGSDRICKADAEEMLAEQEAKNEEEEETSESEAMKICLETARMAQAIASDAHAHILALYKLVPEPATKVLAMYEAEQSRKVARIEHLEQTHQDLLEMREEFKSGQHMRDLELKKFEAQQARRKEIWDGFKNKVGPILTKQLVKSGIGVAVGTSAAATGNTGAPGNTGPGAAPEGNTAAGDAGLAPPTAEEQIQITALRALLRTAELGGQLEMMKQLDGFVTPEQIAHIDAILSRAPDAAAPDKKPDAAPPSEPAAEPAKT